jgi:hypothetical protein
VHKWRRRFSTADAHQGPTEFRSTVRTFNEEAIIVTFRKRSRLPLAGSDPTVFVSTRASTKSKLSESLIAITAINPKVREARLKLAVGSGCIVSTASAAGGLLKSCVRSGVPQDAH